MVAITKYPPGPTYKIPGKLLHQFIHDPINTLTRIAQKYGDISYFTLGRQQHVYLVNNPHYIEKVLIYDHRNFKKGKRLQTAKAILGEGLVTSEGDFHNRQRRLIQPIFHPKQITTYSRIMTDYAACTRDRWKDGDILDIQQEMMQLTLGIICKSALNYDIESEEARQVSKALTICRNYSKRLQSPIGHVLDKVPILPAVRGAREAKKELDNLVYGLIADRTKRQQQQESGHDDKGYDDLLSRLMQAKDSSTSGTTTSSRLQSDNNNNTNGKMSNRQVRDEVMTIFIAGHETTANALTWTFYLLSQNPHIEKKLHDEIDSVLGTSNDSNSGIRVPADNDIPKLQYTEKVLRESMRIYPPVWTIGRYVENDYSLDKYSIPAGSSLLMSQYVMHHDPRYYDQPERFNPDRWTEEFKAHLPRFSYFPFGGGIRGCIGETFAWMEGVLIIAIIAQKWIMRLVPGYRVKLDPAITLRPKYGMKMKLTQRKK